MKRSFVLLISLLSVSFSACSREAAAPATTQGATATTSAPAAAPTGQTADTASGSEATAPASSTALANPPASSTAAAASAPDTADADAPPVGTTSLEKIADLPAQHQLPDGKWKPGVNYDPVVPSQPTSVPAGKVEVLEVFWFACPHCYALEPFLKAWRKTKPDYVEFVRVPVMWGPVHRAHAQLYYTLKQLGRDDLDDKVFDTLHNGQNPMVGNTPDETLQKQLQFATANGIDAEAFRKAYNSFAVNTDLQRAEEITQRYHVEGVPLIVVNGKYITDVGKAGSDANLVAEINDLAASEHKR
ncbi:MAG TPA: thiol:disulfide interchange protein DsbA/DsbL [Steroidobacteraceae bacterium]|jgi:thiol:disulfide interchange protein DsbA|nr:thiol:disulfide interchange protein DsbA/DsbL [Steroidobacteraceae bacterium]